MMNRYSIVLKGVFLLLAGMFLLSSCGASKEVLYFQDLLNLLKLIKLLLKVQPLLLQESVYLIK